MTPKALILRTAGTNCDYEAQAALEGASQVAVAIAASTLTSVIVFLPLIVGAKNNITIMRYLSAWLFPFSINFNVSR